MKKFFSLMMIAAAAVAFVACGESNDEPVNGGGTTTGGKLAAPTVEVAEVTETGFTLQWAAVEGADSYRVNMDGKNYTTAETTYTFENLNAGNYTVRVMASGEGRQDSDWSKVSVEVTGLTSADWFTQLLSLVEEPDVENNYYPYNSVVVSWKGEGITDIRYGVFATASVEGATTDVIKENLQSFSNDELAQLLPMINGEGVSLAIGGCVGSTSYTAYALVENEEGLEYLAVSEITTAEAVATEATKAWLGDFTAKTPQIYSFATAEGQDDTILDEVTEFSFNVSLAAGTADEVVIDGLSIMGVDTPAFGMVVEQDGLNYLGVFAYEAIADLGEGYYAVWLPFCDLGSQMSFVTGSFPAFYLVMDSEGDISYMAYEGDLSNGGSFVVKAFDIIGFNESAGYISFLQDQEGGIYSEWKFGDYYDIQKSATRTARLMNRPAKQYSLTGIAPQSVVY